MFTAAAKHMFIVAAFAATIALAGIWSLPPLDRDEARFAQAATQMLETGDFVAIRFQDQERNKKPAGIYWLQAASVSILSDAHARAIWAHRVPSLIGVVFAAIFTYLCAARMYDKRTAFLAGLLIASAPVVAAEGMMATADAVTLALACLSQLALIHIYAKAQEQRVAGWRWPVLFWTAQGAGVLVKGPIGLLISFLTGLGLLTGRPRFSWISKTRPIAGLVILALIVAPWAAAIAAATDGRFFADAVGGDMLGKLINAQEGHAAPPGYHAVLVWTLFWPASALIVPGAVRIWRERAQWRARFLLSWIVPGWIFFEIAATKLPHYAMPLYPALAIVAARAAAGGAGPVSWPQKAGALAYAAAGLIAAALIAALPILFDADPIKPFSFAAAALTASAALSIAALFWRGRAYKGGVAAAALAVVYVWTLTAGVLPRLPRLAITLNLSATLETAGRHPLHHNLAPVAVAGYSEPSAVFLLGTDTLLTNANAAAARLTSGDASAAIIERRLDAAFHSAIGEKDANAIRALAVIDGFNYSNAKFVSLTIYVREAPD